MSHPVSLSHVAAAVAVALLRAALVLLGGSCRSSERNVKTDETVFLSLLELSTAFDYFSHTSKMVLTCRFYEQKYPEMEDVVMVNVRSIEDMGAYVYLLEYNNIEGKDRSVSLE